MELLTSGLTNGIDNIARSKFSDKNQDNIFVGLKKKLPIKWPGKYGQAASL